MPVALPAIAAGALAATSIGAVAIAPGVIVGTGIFFSFSTFALTAGATLALQLVSKALAPKPPKQGASLADQRAAQTTNYKQPITNHKLVLGQTRVGGPIVFVSSTSNNDYLHMVIILAAHRVAEIGDVIVDDYTIPSDWLDTDGNVTQGKYAGVLRIRKFLGDDNQAADPFMVSEIPEWTINHRLRGLSGIYVRLKAKRDAWATQQPQFTAIVRGMEFYDPRIEETRWTPNLGLMAAGYMQNPTYGPSAISADVDESNTISVANVADEVVDTGFIDVEINSIDPATDMITLDGETLQFQYGDRVEILNANSPSVAPGGLLSDTDYFVIPYQFNDTPRVRLAASLDDAIAGSYIDITSTGTGPYTLRKTGEPRYHGSGVLDTGAEIGTNLGEILSGMGAKPNYSGGMWRIKPQIWAEPVVSLTEGDMRGSITMQTKTSRSDRFNSVKGQFQSPINDWQPQDYPVVVDLNYLANDMNISLPMEMDLPFTTRAETAQRIARVEMRRSRQEITAFIPFSLAAFIVQAGDNISLTSDRLGWDEKIFEVTELSLGVSENAAEGSSESGGIVVTLALRETAEESFDWSASLATNVDPAPNTNLPNAFVTVIPTGVSYSTRQVLTAEGDSVWNLSLQWNSHDDAFVREGGRFEIAFKENTEDNYRPSFTADGTQTKVDIAQISVNISYDMRIRAVNNAGVPSQWVEITGAVAGTSNGVNNQDWGSVADAPSGSQDWGLITDAPSGNQDYEYIA